MNQLIIFQSSKDYLIKFAFYNPQISKHTTYDLATSDFMVNFNESANNIIKANTPILSRVKPYAF